ncbi:MAG: ESPR-type extended signal peptide-containing protein, partial [Dialister sp.]|nr:ESPR-type extended signal peptide-containing protein [Dialister sp.]
MNKIYKIVWSKIKNTYVVVSEVAKSHSKAISSRQRKSIAAVMTVLALGFAPGGVYAAIDGVTTFVEPGNQNVKIGNGISLRNNNGKNGAVAIGDHVQIDDYVMQEGSVAIGKNAFVENMYGNQEKFFKFNQQDITKWASSIAIGQNAYARSGSTMIGDHKYIGKLGDTEVDGSNVLNVKSKNVNINATTIGANSYNQGAFSSVLGTYSIISGKYNGSNWSSYVTQNMGASIVGSLNSIESASSSSGLSGIANSVVGIANRTNNANGALIFGAGNEIENSIGTLSGINMFSGGGDSAKDFADTLRKTVKSSNGGGAVLAIGGGNKANYAKASQLMGVNNTLTGTENAASDYNLLNGFKNVGTNISHVSVIGSENQVNDTKNALVFGDKRKLTKANGSVVLGVSDTVKEIKVEDVTVIGHNALATGANAVAIGHDASADSLSTVAIGDGAKVSSDTNLSGGVAIGKKSNVINGNGRQEKYLGFGTLNDPQRSATGVAIGAYSFARTGSIQIGAHTYLGKMGGIEVTNKTNGEANHTNQTTVGTNTFNKGVFGTMIGAYSISTGDFTGGGRFNSVYAGQNFGSTVVGSLNTIQSKGHGYSAGISNSIVGLANVTENTNGTLIFGAGNKVTNSIKDVSPGNLISGAATPDEMIEKLRKMTIDNKSGGSTMVIGGGNTADYTLESQIMGVNNTLKGKQGAESTHNLIDGFGNNAENVTHVTMIGSDSEVKDTTDAVLLGDKRKLTGADGSIVLGSADESAETNIKDATVIGHNANTTVASGVALGSGSVADRAGFTEEKKGVFSDVDLNGKTAAAVSVGTKDKLRQIINVGDATEDTDAVNLRQLKAATKNITDSITDTKLKADTNALSLDGTKLNLSIEDTKGTKVTGSVDLKTLQSAVDTNTTYTMKGTENKDNTTTISITDSNGKEQKVTVATKDTNTYTTGGTYDAETKKLKFTQNDPSKNYEVDVSAMINNVVDTNTTYTLEGKEDKEKNTTTIALKGSDGKEQKVTVATKDTRNTIVESDTVAVEATEQEDKSVEYKLNVKTDGKVEKDNKGIVTGGTVYNETRIEKDGKYIKVENTAGQNLTALDKQVDANTTNITKLGDTIDAMGDRVNRVGAGAAALAALHPLDFDPDDKWDFAAGYGNYKGANAAAIGAYYRPNEDTMFSVGGSFGGGENMVNAGVSVKLGQGNHVSTSKVAMAKDMLAMQKRMAEMEAQMAKMQGFIGALTGMDTQTAMFPDVPENHWAYEYVKGLCEQGIIDGYPDGNFNGNRSMTRYEFAAMLYRALAKGVSLDARAVKEFAPELGRIRVDVISQNKEGQPVIERVRV